MVKLTQDVICIPTEFGLVEEEIEYQKEHEDSIEGTCDNEGMEVFSDDVDQSEEQKETADAVQNSSTQCKCKVLSFQG